MKPWSLPSLFTLALAGALTLPLAAAFPPAAPRTPDWKAIAGTYPQGGTLASLEELAILHWLQDTRTRADVARAVSEGKPDLGLFLAAIGSGADSSAFPATKAMLRAAKEDLKQVVHDLKISFARLRPYVTDPTLIPAFPDDTSFSCPSRHATEGKVFADLLAQVDPGDQAALEEEGKLIGSDRAMASVHWPSDVTAGQRLGAAFAAFWVALPGNAQWVQDASQEWQAKVR